ncbi:MAG TPA: hypothetical protein PKV40_07920 [Candidatus Kapabacteria bacterium]|nr:hypothetical protein [Candidatus Kapabacteria bacterium]
MSRLRGTFNYSANLEVKKTAPLDARLVVETKADLINLDTWKDLDNLVWLYKGMVVAVVADSTPSNNGLYFLIDETQYTSYAYWQKIGASSSTILTYDGSIEGNDVTTIFPIIHNLNTLKQNVEIWDSSTNETIYPAITKGSSTNYISFYTPPPTGSIYNITILGF